MIRKLPQAFSKKEAFKNRVKSFKVSNTLSLCQQNAYQSSKREKRVSYTCISCGKKIYTTQKQLNTIVIFKCRDCISTTEPTKCLTCGSVFTKDYRGDFFSQRHSLPRFCSKSCANKYSISQLTSSPKTKQIQCIDCGEYFLSDIRTRANVRCSSCRVLRLKERNKQYRNTFKLKKSTCPRKPEEKRPYYSQKTQYYWPIDSVEGILERKYISNKQRRVTLEKLNFDFSTSVSDLDKEVEKIYNFFYKNYIEKELSCKEIFECYGIRTGVTQNFLKILKIPIRTASEASALAISKGRKLNFFYNTNEKCYKKEKHLTWDGKNFLLRSSYETRFANLLDYFKINYTVEDKYFKYFSSSENCYKGAIPDFYLEDYRWIVETKGEHLYDDIDLLDRKRAINDASYTFSVLVDTDLVELESSLCEEEFFSKLSEKIF